jgi:hypothetical protein
MFVCRRCQLSNLFRTASTSAAMARYLPSLSNAAGHYAGAWAPWVGGRALAEGRIRLLSVFYVSARLGRFRHRSTFVYVLTLILRVLLGSRGCLVITDQRYPQVCRPC